MKIKKKKQDNSKNLKSKYLIIIDKQIDRLKLHIFFFFFFFFFFIFKVLFLQFICYALVHLFLKVKYRIIIFCKKMIVRFFLFSIFFFFFFFFFSKSVFFFQTEFFFPFSQKAKVNPFISN